MNCLTRDHPRLRGEYPYKPGDPIRLMGITPACAGNTAGGAPDLRCNRDHPRLRGEYLFQRYNGLHSAGNTNYVNDSRWNRRDHPRLRGEYPRRHLPRMSCLGSPPLARGIPPGCIPRRSRHRITPACAGNTHGLVEQESGLKDHPRLRGEYLTPSSKG